MRSAIALGVVLGVVLVLASCGGGSTTTAPDEKQQVSEALTGFFAAEGEADFQRACAYLTPTRKDLIVQGARSLRPKSEALKVSSCPEALTMIFKVPGLHEVVANLRGVSDVTVSGNSAKAIANSTTADGSRVSNHYVLAKTSDGWKIAEAGGTNPGATVAPP